jgi:hypothetical protein
VHCRALDGILCLLNVHTDDDIQETHLDVTLFTTHVGTTLWKQMPHYGIGRRRGQSMKC